MVKSIGENPHQKPFAGELGRLGQIHLNHIAEPGAAADILMTGIDHHLFFLHKLQKFQMLSFISQSDVGIVSNDGRRQKMVMSADDHLLIFIKSLPDEGGIFSCQRGIGGISTYPGKAELLKIPAPGAEVFFPEALLRVIVITGEQVQGDSGSFQYFFTE